MTGTRAELAALGPYFAVDTHQLGRQPAAPWRPMTELVERPELLRQQIDAVRSVLAARAGLPPAGMEWRVAASTVHLGLVARLVAPALGVAVLTGRVPAWTFSDTCWQPAPGGPYPLSVPSPVLGPMGGAGGTRSAAAVSTWIATGPVAQLTGAIRAAGSISDRVLAGNIASALCSAAEQIATARPDLGADIVALVDLAGDRSPLAGTGRILPSGRFRRNSCCLIYRAAPAGTDRVVCTDCVLAAD